jgi:O-antigen/teichoic acid export membrane protein
MQKRSELLSQIAISLADQVVVSACSFIAMIAVSRCCTQADVGSYTLVWTVINFMRTVQERMIAAPYLAFAYRPGFDRPTFKGSSFAHQSILGLATVLGAFFAAAYGWSRGLDRDWMVIALSLLIVMPFTLLRDHVRAIAAADFKFKEQLLLDLAVAAIQVLGIFTLYKIHHFSIAWLNVVLGLSCMLPSLLWLFSNRRGIRFDINWITQDWLHNWNYSKWLVGARVIGIFGYVILPWMVWFYLDKDATGAFGVCSSLVGVSFMFVTGLNNLFQPRTIRELQLTGLSGMWRCLLDSIIVVLLILIVISFGFYFFGGYALALIYGSNFGSYGFLTFLLSLSTLSVSLSILFGNGLAALGNSKQYFLGELICCLASVGSALALIPLWGLNGAAISLVIGGFAASVVTGLTLVRSSSSFAKAMHDDGKPDRGFRLESASSQVRV